MDPAEIQNMMRELQSPGLEMDEEQLALAHKFCAILEDMSSDRCRQVIKIANKSPVIQIYMSDGWACDMRSRATSSHGEVHVQRHGRLRTESLLQRAIFKCRRGDQWHLGMTIQRPGALATTKCADIFCAATDVCPMLALSGHKGIGIHIY